MKALIVVDVQNDFTKGGALEVPDGDSIVPVVNNLQKRFELVVATQDWHPASHKSFASGHMNRKPFDQIVLNGLDQVLWPDHCVQGTNGAEFHPSLDTNRIEAIFRKGMDPEIDSYSGFYDNGHRKATGLAGYLKSRMVTDVYVCGLASDYCVYFTARDAKLEGFNTFYIEDATRWITIDGFTAAKKDLAELGVSLLSSESVR
jgi:nicotinamidase/pyrazinamidase